MGMLSSFPTRFKSETPMHTVRSTYRIFILIFNFFLHWGAVNPGFGFLLTNLWQTVSGQSVVHMSGKFDKRNLPSILLSPVEAMYQEFGWCPAPLTRGNYLVYFFH